MTIYSVNNEYFIDYDLALLKSLNTNYKLKTHDVNESTNLEAHNLEGETVTILAEDEEFEVDFYMGEVARDEWEAYDIYVKGVAIEKTGLSEELKKDIINECENVADRRNR